MNTPLRVRAAAVAPYALRDAPSLIETQFPVGRVSAESHKERKAGAGQTLTAIGSYWKGRKPLVLVRAAILACLMPATSDPAADLRIFLKLLGMSDDALSRRLQNVPAGKVDIESDLYRDCIEENPKTRKPRWRTGLASEERQRRTVEWLSSLAYRARIEFCARPEDCSDEVLDGIWPEVNGHLGTSARSFDELVEQLGIMRFGARPRVADTFSGGGSIPFEAARMGCDVYASDLNPIACMLTWGAFHIVGSTKAERAEMEREQTVVSAAVEGEIGRLGVEVDEAGNRAKAFLYCLETRCPKTDWLVPLSQSWLISTRQNVIAELVPDRVRKRYDIVIRTGVTDEEAEAAKVGTLTSGRLVHPVNPDKAGVSIETIRGDYRSPDGRMANALRLWSRGDIIPREDDIFRERLYCIQWIGAGDRDKRNAKTFYRAVTDADLVREETVCAYVRQHLSKWQQSGAVPDMPISPGEKTDEPIRTRGWTYWHHLFAPRQLMLLGLTNAATRRPFDKVLLSNELNFHSKLCGIHPRTKDSGREMCLDRVFINQALNTLINYGVRSAAYPADNSENIKFQTLPDVEFEVRTHPASEVETVNHLYVTDPPYADAINYHEITEYFIAWLRNNNPPEFSSWVWDSQRLSAIKGTDEKFRADMVAAYRAMSHQMPDNGMQVVMFTHQDAAVWADLAAIMWAAGLRVTAAWNVVTETESARKDGNYVQGTILLILRKRLSAGNIKRMDIEGLIEEEVERQLASLASLDDHWTSEQLFTDGDLQLAAYAAALRVITNYATIDRKDVGADVYRQLARGERTVVRDLVEYASSVANNKLVPDGFSQTMWRELDVGSRFYIRMLDMESKGSKRVSDYQDFARTFSFDDYTSLMDPKSKTNAASLAGAATLRGAILGGEGFGISPLRRVLFATYKSMQKNEPKEGLAFLRNEYGPDYWSMRLKLAEIAKYLALKTIKSRPAESQAADLVGQRLEVDRL